MHNRGCFKITYSKNLFIAATEIQNFETSLARLLKQALTIDYKYLMEKFLR
jgi:hypothetical protein